MVSKIFIIIHKGLVFLGQYVIKTTHQSLCEKWLKTANLMTINMDFDTKFWTHKTFPSYWAFLDKTEVEQREIYVFLDKNIELTQKE